MLLQLNQKVCCLLATIGILLACMSEGQAQGLIWSSNYGGDYNEQGYSGCALPDGGYAVLGSTFSFGDGDHDIYLLRLNSFGDTLWTRSYGGSSADYGHDIQTTSDSGFIIVGLTRSFGSGNGDVYLIKTDSSGNVTWSRTFGGGEFDEGWSVRQASDGGFVVCGTTNSFGAGYADVYLLKTDASGNLQWSKTFGGSGGESGSAVRRTLDGGYILTGSTGSFGTGYSSIYVIRTDSDGDSLWIKTFGGLKADFGYSVETLPDGSFIFAGASSSFGLGYGDAYLFKIDSDGFLLWEQAYGGSKDDRAYAVLPTSDGGYIMAGTTESFGSGKIDCYVVRTDPLGEVIWKTTYGGSRSDFCRNIFTEPGSFCLIGHSYSFTSGGSDIYVVKADGEHMTAVEETFLPGLPESFFLAQNYPNPFNMTTTIEYTLSRGSQVRLTIYNVLGQEVALWNIPYAPAGTGSVVWDGHDSSGSPVSSGVYFYRFESADLVQTKKMVLIK